ncbi:MAG: hypothetical protein D6690_05915 [Nitrospirae bacterium]|nr:MAG: hypothetical protein D6690_05915 [Nitrospirota bacterium]
MRSRFPSLLLLMVGLTILFSFQPPAVFADEEEDMEALQRALNQQVLDRPFDPGDRAAVDKYLEESLKKGVKPVESPPPGWRPGWTCANLTYSFRWYRNCLYYHHYYGYYWPYP